MSQAGLSYIPPIKKPWYKATAHTYNTTIFLANKKEQETFAVATLLFNIEEQKSKEDFMTLIKNRRQETPNTGRFERIKQSLVFYKNINMCVKHRVTSKDFGAKRNSQYTIYEEYGMYCVHPYNSKIGVFIELSRKAPFDYKNKSFDKWGEEFLKSVEFSKFKV